MYIHSAPLYMPQVAMTLSTDRTVASDAARTPVSGLHARRERGGDDREVVGIHRDGALAEVALDHQIAVADQAPVLRSRWAMARLRCPVSRSDR